MKISRRGLATGAALGGGLLVAWWWVPRSVPNPLAPAEGEFAFDAWLKIGEDGVVTVAVPQCEMGQGITTLLPQIIADELGADWRQIAVEPAAVSGAYANVPLASRWLHLWDPLLQGVSESLDASLAERLATARRFNATADGTSIAAYEEPCRIAAAGARAMLAMEAAERWGANWEQCEVSGGLVRLGQERAAFGELAAGAATRVPPDPPPLRPDPPAEVVFSDVLTGPESAGLAHPRIDLPSKVDGSHQYASDVRLPGMVYASIRHGPNHGAQLTGFDVDRARGFEGIKGVVRSKRWVAVAATTWWTANEALKAMKPQFKTLYPVESGEIAGRLSTSLNGGPSFRIAEKGLNEKGGDALQRVDFARRYEVEPALAAPLETASAAARYAGGRLELWMAAQAPEQARTAAAKALGIRPEDVALYPMPAGGSYDARLEHDHAIEVALIAREIGAPVQLTWPRRDELVRSRPRAPAHMLLGAQLARPLGASRASSGSIDALRVRIACPPSTLEFGERLFRERTCWAAIRESEGEKDVLACEGAVPPYRVPRLAVDHVPVEIGLPTGRVRGNAHSYTAFAMESFIDEIAAAHNREPLSYRISMLGDDARLAACLQRAARLAEWNGGADQSGQGLACHRIGSAQAGGRIACVATARAGEGGVRVTSLSVAVDIGRIINRDIALQQIEGGLIFGLGLAMGAAPRWRAGLPTSFRYEDLGLPKLSDCPKIEVAFIASTAPPADPGELGVVVAPPAIANAFYSATGLRLRRLPLLSDGL
ncbi:MAG: molybdopterin-dependent oxidoreductase [Erythrobacter sp.]|uniref:xanthine dehydrogenase family protein molybdopterin-binding subunit n=1 Tax=Erythrobacter sp. TaxID=1042 RepID=UPI00262369BA|nr:molybdopterin cofactor-binding domain-containing protein [Erythrobacter sp.]MDJ0979072.1 molybdopterin-dependent oxidoreductase [Erythrobacter sp.]